ncbi:hypothetical protein BCO37747_06640 [Burkholderia contaminans]|uniref:Uncharacterized protein n=1 Tax=Burkholderia aenigmatica TaxID=2015348 RepID=A0A6J5JFK0_9BURK|nr:hypothetical protein BLA3211_05968 [Burkholderia aenigmatica]VWD55784.1 hypothetical protein BCO37747_06640 [Burkholderia contaminans]
MLTDAIETAGQFHSSGLQRADLANGVANNLLFSNSRVDHQQPCLGVRDLVLKRLNGYFRFCLSLLVGGNLFGGDTSKF